MHVFVLDKLSSFLQVFSVLHTHPALEQHDAVVGCAKYTSVRNPPQLLECGQCEMPLELLHRCFNTAQLSLQTCDSGLHALAGSKDELWIAAFRHLRLVVQFKHNAAT